MVEVEEARVCEVVSEELESNLDPMVGVVHANLACWIDSSKKFIRLAQIKADHAHHTNPEDATHHIVRQHPRNV